MNTSDNRNYAFQTYKTLEQQETEAFLAMAEAMKALQIQLGIAEINLAAANERIRQLESQVYGGNTQ